MNYSIQPFTLPYCVSVKYPPGPYLNKNGSHLNVFREGANAKFRGGGGGGGYCKRHNYNIYPTLNYVAEKCIYIPSRSGK